MNTSQNPVVVLGAGPIGLAAAAHLSKRELPFLILEKGVEVGTSMTEWGHIRMFSPWQYTVDATAVELLGDSWVSPDLAGYPTGSDMVEQYLEPLANQPSIAPNLRFGHEVVSIHRAHMGRSMTPNRADSPLVVTAATESGLVRINAQAIIDATGTWTQPNPASTTGIRTDSEIAASANIEYGAPDVAGAHRERYANKRVAVIGGGHTAQNVLRALATLRSTEPETEIHWLVRRGSADSLYGSGSADELSQRAALGSAARDLVDSGVVRPHTGFLTHEFATTHDGVRILSLAGGTVVVDEVIVATGQRPDHSITTELQIDTDPITEATRHLGPLIDPNLHSCATVPPHGHREVGHPEPNFYTVGMKSYGRAPTFLLMTGYEQVRSVVAALAGDMEAANAVDFVLPESGVCGVPTARVIVTSTGEEVIEQGECCG
jgi:thioredoxin reductase